MLVILLQVYGQNASLYFQQIISKKNRLQRIILVCIWAKYTEYVWFSFKENKNRMVTIHNYSCGSLYYIIFVQTKKQPTYYRSFHQSRVAKKLLNVGYIHIWVFNLATAWESGMDVCITWPMMTNLIDQFFTMRCNWCNRNLNIDCTMLLRSWISSSDYPNHLVHFVHLVDHMALHV